jgi:hypothetical protein
LRLLQRPGKVENGWVLTDKNLDEIEQQGYGVLTVDGFAGTGIYLTDSAFYADEHNFRGGELRRKLVYCEVWMEEPRYEVRNGATIYAQCNLRQWLPLYVLVY